MDLRSPLTFTFILIFVEIVTLATFTLFTHPKLTLSSQTLAELSKNLSNLSTNVSQISLNLSRTAIEFSNHQHNGESSNDIFELKRNVSKLMDFISKNVNSSKNVPESSNNFSELSKSVEDLSKNMSELTRRMNHLNPSGLYSFGGYDNGKYSSSASRLNTITGKWEKIRSMSVAKDDSCGVVIGNKIYLFGGYSPVTGRSDIAEVYNPVTDTYEQLQSMPYKVEECGAAVLNGYIYVAGGDDESSLVRISTVVRYHIGTDQWSTVSSLQVARYALQMVELSGQLYAISGSETRAVEVYDLISNRWSYTASTHYLHKYFGAAVHEGKIYVGSHAGFEVYSPDTNKWSILTSLNSYTGRTLVSMNGKLWALGGDSSKSVHTYDTSTGQWTRQADMDVARQQHTSFVVNYSY